MHRSLSYAKMFKKLLISGLYATYLLNHILPKHPHGLHAAKIITESFLSVDVNELSEKLMLSIVIYYFFFSHYLV